MFPNFCGAVCCALCPVVCTAVRVCFLGVKNEKVALSTDKEACLYPGIGDVLSCAKFLDSLDA